jgi:hypothetical protein
MEAWIERNIHCTLSRGVAVCHASIIGRMVMFMPLFTAASVLLMPETTYSNAVLCCDWDMYRRRVSMKRTHVFLGPDTSADRTAWRVPVLL